MELTTQTIKNITAMNIHAGVHEIAKALGQEVKHVGNHVAERMGHLTDQMNNTSLNEDENAELTRQEHLLMSLSKVMDMVTALVQANDIGYKMVMTEPSESQEEMETVKAIVTESTEYIALLEVMDRLKRETEQTAMDELMALIGGNPWDKDSVDGE